MKNNNNITPTNLYNDKYSSLIRSIKIHLPHREYKEEDDEHKYDEFVGRDRQMECLYNWLSDRKNESGSYLVTGFRGMGKTKLVERVTDRLTREVKEQQEPWWRLIVLLPVLVSGVFFASKQTLNGSWGIVIGVVCIWITLISLLYLHNLHYFDRKKKRDRRKYPNHNLFSDEQVSRMARGKKDDYELKRYKHIKISVNLGHEVLRERDVLSMIATSVRDKYKAYVNSYSPHLLAKALSTLCVLTLSCTIAFAILSNASGKDSTTTARQNVTVSEHYISSDESINTTNQQFVVNGGGSESWVIRFVEKTVSVFRKAMILDGTVVFLFRLLFFILLFVLFRWLFRKLFSLIPYYSAPIHALRRLDTLTERLNTITGEDSNISPSTNSGYFTISLFNHRQHKTKPIADIREIETELADIINLINSDKCPKGYKVKFIVVFDEMDKIDPAMMEKPKSTDIPEFTDSVKGFPEGLESRERRHNVLKLLANIKLFVSTAKAKFVFISGRELYDAYLADLSDRDFAISSIFTGVINIDSFLTPEGGQTDVRSMSEWYIANRLIPGWWLERVERRNAKGQLKREYAENESRAVLKKELPSLRWYYEYLIEECHTPIADATYVIGFLHIFAAYLTHISNGSPKKIFLYFEKHIRHDKDSLPMNDWGDVLTVGKNESEEQEDVLFFEPTQQKTINFVYYLANPIMGTITNDLSNYGDRFLVSLSFIIDHIYKHHNRSFSWRNMEQIPDLLETSKAPELRNSMMSIMEYLAQTHISPILIGLNEYKFNKSIAEEISVMSKMSDEASAIFNFTLDESLSVIQHNTKLLNHYMELDKAERESGSGKRQYLTIIARIHSNLGDLHFWDEDYYAASLEYRAAIDAFSKDEMVSGFLTRIRCILKLGLTYESRRLFPNAYQLYCQLMELLIKKRWIHTEVYGLDTKEQHVDDWRGRRQILVEKDYPYGIDYHNPAFETQFYREMVDPRDTKQIPYSMNVDGIISSFAQNLTEEKTATISSLTVFEEVRYVYQAILAKLSILEKMGMSGITQTNINVAEGEFKAIHKSVNIREKFIISADFFRKLAEIMYYKNSLTILSQNQSSLRASVYYDDFDILSHLDDFCKTHDRHAFYEKDRNEANANTVAIINDVRSFFMLLDNPASQNDFHPKFDYNLLEEKSTYKDLFEKIRNNLDDYLLVIQQNDLSISDEDAKRIKRNVKAYLNYCIDNVHPNESMTFFHKGVEVCDYHSQKMREQGLRPPCYACKYYTRSLRILAENMYGDKNMLSRSFTRSYSILLQSFKSELLYTRSNHIRILAQTLEGFGNIMLSCASGDNREGKSLGAGRGISMEVIDLIKELFKKNSEEEEREFIKEREGNLSNHPLSRLDKSILYYYDAYRFYLMDSCHHEAAGCLNKIVNLLAYYIEVLCYYNGGKELGWKCDKEAKAVEAIIGDSQFHGSILAILFRFIARHTSYKYDATNLSEISELKSIYSKEKRDNIDLTRLSLYPALRSAWLRIVEIRAKGMNFLEKVNRNYKHEGYLDFIKQAYPLIAPKDRYRTTFYEEVLGFYTKMRFNDHIMNDLLGGNPMLDKDTDHYADTFHVLFYQQLADYLESPVDMERIDSRMFETGDNVDKRLKVVEYLILDTLVCVTSMVKVFVPHNNLSSYSNSFIGIIYNFYWEWSHKYEFVHSLYQYCELVRDNRRIDADRIVQELAKSSSITRNNPEKAKEVFGELRSAMDRCRKQMSRIEYTDNEEKYGSRSERFKEQLRHKVDDITLVNIISNYPAEMALKYYKMAEEANTEGTAYKEMMGTMYFLDDDFNNDTNQFNIACDRFLLNCGVVSKQRNRLERLYKYSNVYHLRHAYIEGPNRIRNEEYDPHQFDRSQFINSEY